jgi:hypothetical protein
MRGIEHLIEEFIIKREDGEASAGARISGISYLLFFLFYKPRLIRQHVRPA